MCVGTPSIVQGSQNLVYISANYCNKVREAHMWLYVLITKVRIPASAAILLYYAKNQTLSASSVATGSPNLNLVNVRVIGFHIPNVEIGKSKCLNI